MRSIKYILTTGKFSLDGDDYDGFGIDACDNGDHVIESVSDVSCCRFEAENLVCLCNSSNLSEIHLLDVIEDHINE